MGEPWQNLLEEFQTFAMSWILYSYLYTIPQRLNFMCRRFGTLFHLHSWCKHSSCLTAYEDGTDRVFRNVGTWNSNAGKPSTSKNTTCWKKPQFFKICKTNSIDRLYRGSQKSFRCDEADDIFSSRFQLLCASLCVLVPAFFKTEEKLWPGTGIAQVPLVYQWSWAWWKVALSCWK